MPPASPRSMLRTTRSCSRSPAHPPGITWSAAGAFGSHRGGRDRIPASPRRRLRSNRAHFRRVRDRRRHRGRPLHDERGPVGRRLHRAARHPSQDHAARPRRRDTVADPTPPRRSVAPDSPQSCNCPRSGSLRDVRDLPAGLRVPSPRMSRVHRSRTSTSGARPLRTSNCTRRDGWHRWRGAPGQPRLPRSGGRAEGSLGDPGGQSRRRPRGKTA